MITPPEKRNTDVITSLSNVLEQKRQWSSRTSFKETRKVKRSNSQSNTPLLTNAPPGATPISQTTPIPESTSTHPSGCRPRKLVDQAAKNTLLSDADLSRAVELCMGVNEKPFTQLWAMMNHLATSRNVKENLGRRAGQNDHAKDEKSRLSSIQTFHISHPKFGTKCVEPQTSFKTSGLYTLFTSTSGPSLYLLAEQNSQRDSVTMTRLVFNSSSSDVATLFLGTTKHWRITGNSGFESKISGENEMVISMKGLTVSLVRSVTKWSVVYHVTVSLAEEHGVIYGGLLGHILTGDSVFLTVGSSSDRCTFLTQNQRLITKYKNSPYTFSHFFVNVLHDLSKNLPPIMFV